MTLSLNLIIFKALKYQLSQHNHNYFPMKKILRMSDLVKWENEEGQNSPKHFIFTQIEHVPYIRKGISLRDHAHCYPTVPRRVFHKTSLSSET